MEKKVVLRFDNLAKILIICVVFCEFTEFTRKYWQKELLFLKKNNIRRQNMLEKLKTYAIELRNRNYAHNSIKAYKRHISNFLEYSEENPAMQPEDRIPLFLDSCYKSHEEKRIAYSAIRAFYEYVIKKNCPYTLNKIRRRRRLPGILNREEVIAILSQIKNRKHFLMIALMYASGLRVSEVVKLKVKDIDLQALSIHVRNSKHNTDRYTVFSGKLQDGLAALVKDRRPEEYLFLTIYNKKYAIRTVQEILEKSYLKAGLNKKATSPYKNYNWTSTKLKMLYTQAFICNSS